MTYTHNAQHDHAGAHTCVCRRLSNDRDRKRARLGRSALSCRGHAQSSSSASASSSTPVAMEGSWVHVRMRQEERDKRRWRRAVSGWSDSSWVCDAAMSGGVVRIFLCFDKIQVVFCQVELDGLALRAQYGVRAHLRGPRRATPTGLTSCPAVHDRGCRCDLRNEARAWWLHQTQIPNKIHRHTKHQNFSLANPFTQTHKTPQNTYHKISCALRFYATCL